MGTVQLSQFKNILGRSRNILLAFVFIFTQLFVPLSFAINVAEAGSDAISTSTHQGQLKDEDTGNLLGYTSGNVTTYKELDSINFRFTLDSDDEASGRMRVSFAGDITTGQQCVFFQQAFSLGTHDNSAPAVESISGVEPSVTTVGTPIKDGNRWAQVLDVDFSGGSGIAVVNYHLTLTDEAGNCGGSSTHTSLDNAKPEDFDDPDDYTDDFKTIGTQSVSIPAKDILILPSITIIKSVESGDAEPHEFSFAVSPEINGQSSFSISEGQSSVLIDNVDPGFPDNPIEYTFTESGPEGYVFDGGSGVNCSVVDASIGTPDGQMLVSGLEASSNENHVKNAECTFSNVEQTGSIKIEKAADGDQEQDFKFTATGGGVDDFTLTGTDNKTFSGLSAGEYTFTEEDVTEFGWDLTAISCEDADGTTWDVDTRTATVDLAAGQDVTCKFTNVERGEIVVTKETNPSDSETEFEITASTNDGTIFDDATQTIKDDGSTVTYGVTPGTYDVTENLPEGWRLAENGCLGVEVAAGQSVDCTIKNERLAQLTIIKEAIPASNQVFEFFTDNLSPAEFTLVDDKEDDDSNIKVFDNLNPGEMYKVTEQSTPGWQLTDLDCSSTATVDKDARQVTYAPAPGDDVTCTFTNTKLGSISGTKFEANADGSTSNTLAEWTIKLLLEGAEVDETETDVNGNYTFEGLLPGNYTIIEVLKDDWTQIFEPDEVDLSAGENSTDNDFGNFENVTISGYKWNDLDGNGEWNTETEPGLENWAIHLYQSDDNTAEGNYEPFADTTTDEDGFYSFDDISPLPSRFYKICEVQQTGWKQTYPNTDDDCHEVEVLQSGTDITDKNFGNQGRGTIQVFKNVDENGDGTIDNQGADDWAWDIDGGGNLQTGGLAKEVAAGDYTVSEQMKDGYHFTSVECTVNGNELTVAQTESFDVTVGPGESVVCTFVNTRDTGQIRLVKHLEPKNDKGRFNLHIEGEDFSHTRWLATHGSSTGFQTVATGKYTLSETGSKLFKTNLDEYDTTYKCYRAGFWWPILVASGEGAVIEDVPVKKDWRVTCTFTNKRKPQITVIKNAEPKSLERFLFSIRQEKQNDKPVEFPGVFNGEQPFDPLYFGEQWWSKPISIFSLRHTHSSHKTNSNQHTEVLKPGTYKITEMKKKGWFLENIECDGIDYTIEDNAVYLTVGYGDKVSCTFKNEKAGEVVVTKYEDLERTGSRSETDKLLEDWTITLTCSDQYGEDCDDAELKTDENGQAVFENVRPNRHYEVGEVQQEGWQLIGITCWTNSQKFRLLGPNPKIYYEQGSISVMPGQTVHCEIGNARDLIIELEKENDADDVRSIGDIVTYTLTVSIPETSGISYNTTVTDLPPENFEYIEGSWTVDSNNLNVATEVGAGPTYASPGDWNLGTLFPGDEVVLTYQARILEEVTPGTYPDIAYASGFNTDVGGDIVYSNVHFADEPFDGSEVTVADERPEPRVLAKTGAPVTWQYIAVPVLLIGLAISLVRRETKGAL